MCRLNTPLVNSSPLVPQARMFLFPDLSQTPFLGFHAEIFVEFAQYVPRIAAELKEAFGVARFELKGTDRESFAKPYFISVNIQGGDDSARLEIGIQWDGLWDVVSESETGEADESKSSSFIFVDAREVEATLRKRLAVLDGLNGANVEAECNFAIDAHDLPENGIIRRGLGAKALVGGNSLRLAGAKFSVGDRDPGSDTENWVSWFVEPYSGREVRGSIDFRGSRDLHGGMFAELVGRANDQFQRFILEREAVTK